jgi:hypothetical protein
VVGAVASVVGAIADVDVVDANRIRASSVVVAVKLLTPVVQVIWPTVNERPSATVAESGMMTTLLAWEAVRTPPGAPLSMKPSRQSTKGYAQGSDLSVDRCASYELDGDARHNKVLSWFGRREGIIPTSRV